jgi:alanyl-tRNA synthetase
MSAEQGIEVDLTGFQAAMSAQRRRSQEAEEGQGKVFRSLGEAAAEVMRTVPPTAFTGYAEAVSEARIAAVISGGKLVDSARAGEDLEVVLSRTPFYAEAGGQVGDAGILAGLPGDTDCALRMRVDDTQKMGSVYFHSGRVIEGEVCAGQEVRAAVDMHRRRDIMRNHTATHLLHAALRSILGAHVHQKGSLVAPERLRFDFTHPSPMSPDEIRRVEARVNEQILCAYPVLVHSDLPLAEARARGAMALFGEKYADRVRMIEIPEVSLELCGGTHLDNTSQTGLLKITSESGVASGVRRIEAVTGEGAYRFVTEREEILSRAAQLLKTNPRDLAPAIERLQHQRAQLEQQIQQLRSGGVVQTGVLEETEMDGLTVITGELRGADGDLLAAAIDRAIERRSAAVAVVGSASDGKVLFAAKVTPDLVARGLHAGDLVREVARIAGGGGGGRPDFAQAGGGDASRLQDALAAVIHLVRAQLRL